MLDRQDSRAQQQSVQDAEQIDLPGGRLCVVARMGTDDDDVVLIRARMDQGRSAPLHAHRDPECFYVLAGCIEVFLGDDERRWHPLGQGQSLLVAGGVKHAVRNTSNEPADTMVVTTVRLARFFREVAGPASGHGYRPPTSAELELIRRKAREHGYWLASPED